MTKKNDKHPPSYYAILDAAVEEFAVSGYSGVRMEHVAKRAKFNKSLIYRFFKNREQLFEAALRHQFSQREQELHSRPESLAEALQWWHKGNTSKPTFMRMILREALEGSGKTPVEAENRRQYYLKQIESLEEFQSRGELPSELPAPQLFLSLLAITIIPTALPQIAELVTGLPTESDEFEQSWMKFLEGFSTCLGKIDD